MYVYCLVSRKEPSRKYFGVTKDFKARLAAHNFGKSKHSSKYKPWAPLFVVWLKEPELAHKLEKYLKTGSGKAFAKHHLY